MSSRINQPWKERPSQEALQQLNHQTPYHALRKILDKRPSPHTTVSNVLFWFRDKDLRLQDNKAFCHASEKAAKAQKPLIAIYLYTPESLLWHGISSARLFFMLETLKQLQADLKVLNIPLVILPLKKLEEAPQSIIRFIEKHNISDLYANYEYEINEIRRDINVLDQLSSTVNCFYYHDQTVIDPEKLVTQGKKPLQVFTPYHGAWTQCVAQYPGLIEPYQSPHAQSEEIRKELSKLFDTPIPKPPTDKTLDNSQKHALQKLWPAGYNSAVDKLKYFITHHLDAYAKTRSTPGADSTSRINPYLSIGAISTRTVLNLLKKSNNNHTNFGAEKSSDGIFGWVREIVFREFYRHQLVVHPHLSMNLPQNIKFAHVQWETDELGWQKWCDGQTGIPFIDAGMRQLKAESYMHNRLRMNVASYLYGNLLIDYRRGERYFAEMLIDYDLANNTQGWSPSPTIFNPVLQAEKNDPEGNYIRKWVPELKNVLGKAIFDPYHRLSATQFEELGYPKPHVNLEKTKQRAKERFKSVSKGTQST